MRCHRRRSVPHQQTHWHGKCILEDDPWAGWVECRVLDISEFGAAIEVLEPMATDLIGRRIAVDVQPPPSGAFSVHMVGQVRNTGPSSGDGLPLGMEFVDLTDDERSVLYVLDKMLVEGLADFPA